MGYELPASGCSLWPRLSGDGEGESGVVAFLEGIDQGLGDDPESVTALAYFPQPGVFPA